jgi:hypothetical protein
MKWGGTRIKHVSGSENIYNGDVTPWSKRGFCILTGSLPATGDGVLIARLNSLSELQIPALLRFSNSLGTV